MAQNCFHLYYIYANRLFLSFSRKMCIPFTIISNNEIYEYVIIIFLILFQQDDTSSAILFRHCPWLKAHLVDWIHQVPVIIVLLLNLFFLASIMWVLITKLRSANTVETQQYRKAAKALLVLMPLLGVTYMLMITTPPGEAYIMTMFYYGRAVLLSTQVSANCGNIYS